MLYLVTLARPLTEDGRRNEFHCGILENEAEARKASGILKQVAVENDVGFEHVRFFSTADELLKHPSVKGAPHSKLSPANWD